MGALTLEDIARGGAAADVAAVVLIAVDHLSKLSDVALAASEAQQPQELSKIAEQAERERDAARAASLKWAGGAAATAGSIAGALAAFGGPVGVAAGAVIAVVAGAALAAYTAYQRIEDTFEHDADAAEYVKTATDYAAWFVDHGLPFPHFRREVYKNVQGYADALKRMALSIVNHPSDLRDAVERVGRDMLDSRDEDVVVQAAYLTAGEEARQWPFERMIFQARQVRGWGNVSDREALEILTAAIATSTARKFDLPATHLQAVIDATRDGWNNGAQRGVREGHFHPGIVAMAHAKLAAEQAASDWRAQIDAVAAVEPSVFVMLGRSPLFGEVGSGVTLRRDSMLSELLSKSSPAPSGGGSTAPVSREALDAVKPPPPADGAISSTTKAVIATAAIGAGVSLLVTQTGKALLRRWFGV